jgi:hypothetical protein
MDVQSTSKVVAWIDENRGFVEEVVPVLSRFAPVPSVLNLLYRYRRQAPLRLLPLYEDEYQDWERSEERPGWVYLKKSERAPTPLPEKPVRPRASVGMAWNRVVALDAALPEDAMEEVEEVEEAPDEELLKALRIKDMLMREDAFDTETYNNELLLEVLEDVKEISTRHNCCYGVHSNAFMYALGDLVGA